MHPKLFFFFRLILPTTGGQTLEGVFVARDPVLIVADSTAVEALLHIIPLFARTQIASFDPLGDFVSQGVPG